MSNSRGYGERYSTWSQFKRGFTIGFVGALQAGLASVDQAVQQPSETQKQYHQHSDVFSGQQYVFINGVPLNKVHLVQLHLKGYYPPAGYFWYDPACGAWGNIGGPCLGIPTPGMDMGDGALQRGACSPNTTSTTVNGRLLHNFDALRLSANCVPWYLGPLWIDQNGRYGFEGSWIPIGILNIQNMAIQGFPGAEAFYPRHLDSATRAHLEEELHDLLNRQGTPPYFRSYNDGRGARSYYRPSATSTPDPAVPQPSREEASSGKQQHTRRERDEEFERERREREEQFRREQQDREESRKRQQQEREAKARSEETAKRQREKAAKEAEAQRNTNRWKEYNRAWAELRNMPAASRASRNPRTAIPWPTDIGSFRSCHDVSPYDIEAFFGYGVSVSGRGQLLAILKVERSKWHPDKVQHLFGAQVDEPTMDRVTQISQIVNQLYTQEQAKAP